MGDADIQNAISLGQYWFETKEDKICVMTGSGDSVLQIGWITSGDALAIERFNKTGILSADLLTNPIKIYAPDSEVADPKNVSAVLAFIDVAAGRAKLETTSMGDLMCLVMMLSLESAKEERKILGESNIFKREIASKAIATTFGMKLEAAEKQYESARNQAIGEIVSGGLSIVGGVASIATSGVSLSKLSKAHGNLDNLTETFKREGNAPVAGEANQERTVTEEQIKKAREDLAQVQSEAQNIAAMGQGVNSLTSGLGGFAKGIADFYAAENRLRADKINASVEVMQQWMQTVNSEISSGQQACRDASQQIEQSQSLIKKIFDDLMSATQGIIRNI